MKTKLKTITLLLLCLPSLLFAQIDWECATPDDPVQNPTIIHSGSIDPALYENGEPLVLNVKYWKVNDPNGDFYVDFTEDHLLEGIAHLNRTYNPFNIFLNIEVGTSLIALQMF